MYVINSENGRKIPATISKLDSKEIASVNDDDRFTFDWSLERRYEVYKLTAEGVDGALGLMSIDKRSEDYAYQIKLLACSKENVGSTKKYERIAGCLIAFACKEAFKAGFGGFVCLKPKTVLKDHYQEMYGFTATRLFLISEGQNSLALINKYYEK